MTIRFNPLKKTKTVEKTSHSLTASYSTGMIPLSPISGKPMEQAYCRDVPVWCDLENRLILPVKKAE